MENLFKKALNNKFRFPYKGLISLEDLYDLSIEELDKVYKTLKKDVKEDEESLMSVKTKYDEELLEKIDIVKNIFFEKQEELLKAKEAMERRKKKQKLLKLKASKEDEELASKSIEELNAMLAELDN